MADCDNDQECEKIIPEPIKPEPLPKQCSGGDESGSGTNDFNELENRPKYGGRAMTGDTNIPEVETYEDFAGTDGEEDGVAGLVPAPTTADAGKFLSASGTWEEVQGGGGTDGKARILTADDYNWNSVSRSATAPFDSIAPWLLPSGLYYLPTDVYSASEFDQNKSINGFFNGSTFLVMKDEETSGTHAGFVGILTYHASSEAQSLVEGVYSTAGTWQTGSMPNGAILKRADIANNLTTTVWTKPLSAVQGKVLNEKITPNSNSGVPTTSTVGELGKIYIDTSTDTAYMCVKVSGSTYTWKQITV